MMSVFLVVAPSRAYMMPPQSSFARQAVTGTGVGHEIGNLGKISSTSLRRYYLYSYVVTIVFDKAIME